MVYRVLMVFSLDFNSPYYNIRKRLGDALVICHRHDSFLQLEKKSKRMKRS